MSKVKKRLITLIAGSVVIFIAVLAYIDIALSPTCVNTVIHTSENSTHEFYAVLFERSCGAMTGFSTQVSIIRSGHELSVDVGNVYVAGGYSGRNSLTWVSDKVLLIGGIKYNADKRLERFKDITIIYE